MTDPHAAVALQRKLDRLFAGFRDWCVLWGLARLARDTTIEFTGSLNDALGQCDLRAGRITLNAVLLHSANEGLLHETLCHEAAHLVAHVRYGVGIAEHGPEWQQFMRRAGFPPRAVIPRSRVTGLDRD
jgi:predicted SprT family Zn-dependent metalloprotease